MSNFSEFKLGQRWISTALEEERIREISKITGENIFGKVVFNANPFVFPIGSSCPMTIGGNSYWKKLPGQDKPEE